MEKNMRSENLRNIVEDLVEYEIYYDTTSINKFY